MWFERFVIIVTSLHRDYLPSSWTLFHPSWVDVGIFVGTLGIFFTLYLLFARYFPVPGMNHCSGGPAADQFDLLTPLVQWVEQGVAPQAVPASVRGAGHAGGANAELPKDWSASRTRPLCAYPTVARYAGSGSLEDAASFSCR